MPTQRSSTRSTAKSKGGRGTAKSSRAGGRGQARSASKSASQSKKSAARKSASGARAGASTRRGSAASRTPARKASAGRSRTTPARSRGARQKDALTMLEADHKKVRKLFKQFEKLDHEDAEATRELVETTIGELEIHAAIEEEIFYPAVREAIDADDLMDEAEVEHDTARHLIDQLDQLDPGTPTYAATFKVLGEYVNHHVEEEEGEIFKLARRAKMDLAALGEEIQERKERLMRGESGALATEGDEATAEGAPRGGESRADSESMRGAGKTRGAGESLLSGEPGRGSSRHEPDTEAADDSGENDARASRRGREDAESQRGSRAGERDESR